MLSAGRGIAAFFQSRLKVEHPVVAVANKTAHKTSTHSIWNGVFISIRRK
jgi:hypothetical protein